MIVEKILKTGPSRRNVLAGGLASGFLLAFHLPVRAANEPVELPDDPQGKFAPNAFIRIDHSGRTTLVMPQVEMGQGVYTSMPMILAEELDADFSQVVLEHAPPNDNLYKIRFLAFRQPEARRRSGRSGNRCEPQAQARERCWCRQQRRQWQVEPASCTTSNSEVIHAASGRKLSYGELAIAASQQTPPKDVPLKDPKDFVLIGKPLTRLDTPDKVNGKAIYGIDAMLPDMKFATLAKCPVFGGKVGKVDDVAAKKIPGVRQIVVLDDLVAVVGDHMWAAKKVLKRWSSPGTKVQIRASAQKTSGTICAPQAKRTASLQRMSATSQRVSPPARNLKRRTSFRSLHTRQWSR